MGIMWRGGSRLHRKMIIEGLRHRMLQYPSDGGEVHITS